MKRSNPPVKEPDFAKSQDLLDETLIAALSGASLEEMAKKFCISIQGIKYRLANLYRHFGVKNRVELMAAQMEIKSKRLRDLKNGKNKTIKEEEKPTETVSASEFELPRGQGLL